MSGSTNLLSDFLQTFPNAWQFIEGLGGWEFMMPIPEACEILRSRWLSDGREENLRVRAAHSFHKAWERFRNTPMRPMGYEYWVRFPVRMKIDEGAFGFDSRLGHRDLIDSMMRKSEATEMLRVLHVQTSPTSGFLLEVGGLHKSLEQLNSTRFGNAVGFGGEVIADAMPVSARKETMDVSAIAEALREHWLFDWLCFGG